MGHRKWVKARSWREFHADDMIAEHNALYDAWSVERDRAGDLLKDRNAIQGKLDEARKRIAELESPIRVPFSDDQIERMAKAAQPIVYEGTKWHIIDESAKTALRQGIRAALAAGGLEPCAVPEYEPEDVALSPSDDEVEALARALHAAWNVKRFGVAPKWEDSTVQDAYRDEARAAIAHLAKRPEGLPSVRDLREIGVHAYLSHDSAKRENAGCMVDPMGAAADAVLDALRPWLRDPVGWEMDVHPDQLELYKWVTEPDGGYAYAAQQALDLCRKRIRPVYECKECAKKDTRIDMYERQQNMMAKSIEVQRQGLERAAAAARAALEGE